MLTKKIYLQFFNFQFLFLTDQTAVLLRNSDFCYTYINLDFFSFFFLSQVFPIHHFYTSYYIWEAQFFLLSFTEKLVFQLFTNPSSRSDKISAKRSLSSWVIAYHCCFDFWNHLTLLKLICVKNRSKI